LSKHKKEIKKMRTLFTNTLTIAVVFGIVLSGCGKKKSADESQAEGKPPTQGTQVPTIPPVITTTGTGSGTEKPPTMASGITREEVISTLTFSFSLEKSLRASNKNPAALRAQLVRYRNRSENKAWEMLELAVAAQGDATANVKPFQVLEARMKEFNVNGESLYGYAVIADVITQFTQVKYPAKEIGNFTLRDQKLDLCSAGYADLCHFDFDSTRTDLSIFAWLQ
jgi:hypothetical protein